MNDNPNEETSETQSQLILDHFKRGGHITSLDALRMFGCFRLASRISDLGKRGHIIKREMVKDPITGKRYMMYWM